MENILAVCCDFVSNVVINLIKINLHQEMTDFIQFMAVISLNYMSCRD
jgi:hypothetical protein